MTFEWADQDALLPVGQLHAEYVKDGRSTPVYDWLITTGDRDVADKVFELVGGDAPEKYETKGEDNLRVFSAVKEVEVVIGGPEDLRQKALYFNRSGKVGWFGDGQTLEKTAQSGERNMGPALHPPQNGDYRRPVAPSPEVELVFRIAAQPDLGIWTFRSRSWSLAHDVAVEGLEGQLAAAGGPVRAVLGLEPVSFVSKNGPSAGKAVSYAKGSIKIVGKA